LLCINENFSGRICAVKKNTTNPIFNDNKLKLGTFCTNTVPNMTFLPERRDPTWANTLAGARLADEAGLEAVVPIARWKGYLDDRPDHIANVVFDVFTWAAGLAQATRYSSIFATSHAPTMHPLLVAKQCATIDAISGGRCSLNIVGGWNRREFDMFGIDLMEHDQRYVYLEEWRSRRIRLRVEIFPHEESHLAPAAASAGRHPDHERGVVAGRHALFGEEFRHRTDQPAGPHS
jgi:FMNH2-dependent dimethyl sulfone monooxygenase